MSETQAGAGSAVWRAAVAWGPWLVAAALFALAIGPLARFASITSEWLDYPYPRAGSEGLILYESLLVKRGGDIYQPITPERFISGPYPPIYYWIAAALLPDQMPDFSSPAPSRPESVFEGGRWVSLLSALAAALLLAVTIAVQVRGASAVQRLAAIAGGLLGGILFFSLPQVAVWASRFRGDMLMIALTAAGLACIAAGTRPISAAGVRWPWLVGAALLFSLAFFTKQTAIAAPLSAALYLLLRNRRVGLVWTVVMAAAVTIPFVVLDLLTGHWFFLKMVTYHSLPLSRSTLERLLRFAFWEDQWPLIVLASAVAVGAVVYSARRWNGSRRPKIVAEGPGPDIPLLLPLFALASFVTLPTGAVVGADHNHLLMSGLAIAAASGYGVALLIGWSAEGAGRVGWVVRTAGTLSALLIGWHLVITSPPSDWYSPDLTLPPAQEQEQMRKIIGNVRTNPGTLIFSDDPGFVALAGKETPYDDPFTMTALAPTKRWDETVFTGMLSKGQFALLVLACNVNDEATCRSDTLSPGALDAIRTGYQLLFRDVRFTYVPKEAGEYSRLAELPRARVH